MLIIKNSRYGARKLNSEIKLCRHILNAVSSSEIIKVNIYENISDKINGNIINKFEFNNNELNDIVISNYVNLREHSLGKIIVDLEFNINVDDKLISSYIRINNDSMRRSFGDIEMDIYPFEDVSNFGDLIKKFKLDNFKIDIEKIIKKYPKEFGIIVNESYIAVSHGEPSIDFSKRIWMYYSQPYYFIMDILNFIKNFKELEVDDGFGVPRYIIPDYEEILHKIKPYDVKFLSKQFMNSEGFSKIFNLSIKEKEIEVRPGSLIISSDDIENNFLLARDLSEKMIFPVMKKVTGEQEFREYLKSLS